MPAMIRKQIYLDKATDDELRIEARRRGVSQAEVIRGRLRGMTRPVPPSGSSPGEELMRWLRMVQETAGDGPGSGRKFDRDELYEERLNRQSPRGHKRPRVRS